MDCRITLEKLSSYIDAELSAAELLEIERHLPACARCAGRVERLRTVSGELRGARRPDIPGDAAECLTAVIDANLAARGAAERAPMTPRAGVRTWLRRLAGPAFASAAAAMAVLAVAVIVWSSGTPLAERERGSGPAESESAVKPSRKLGIKSLESAPDAAQPEAGSFSRPDKSFAPKEKKTAVTTFSTDDIRALAESPGTQSYALQDYSADSDFPYAVGPEALAAARVVGGDSEVDLLFATRGLYKNREVWVVVVSPVGAAGPFTAAAVTPEGKLMFRTD